MQLVVFKKVGPQHYACVDGGKICARGRSRPAAARALRKLVQKVSPGRTNIQYPSFAGKR